MISFDEQKSAHGSVVGQSKQAKIWDGGVEVHYIPFDVARKKITALGKQMEKMKSDYGSYIQMLNKQHDSSLKKLRTEDQEKMRAVQGARKEK